MYLSVSQNRHDHQSKQKNVLGIGKLEEVDSDSFCDDVVHEEREENVESEDSKDYDATYDENDRSSQFNCT